MPLKILQPREATPAQREVIEAPVALMDTEMAPAHREPALLTRPPVRRPAPEPQGSRVFEDEAVMDQAIDKYTTAQRPLSFKMAAAPAEEGHGAARKYEDGFERDVPSKPPISFKSEFKSARARGEKEFSYKGGKFETRHEGETNADWMAALTPFEPGFERERSVADIPAAKEVGNQLFQTKHPMVDGSNVLLQSVGGIDPSGEHPPEPVNVIPTMIDGIQLTGREAVDRYRAMGMLKGAPEFATVEEAERWIAENHGRISPEGVLLSEDQEGRSVGPLLDVKNTRTAPTFKRKSLMEAPTETKTLLDAPVETKTLLDAPVETETPPEPEVADGAPQLFKHPNSTSADFTQPMLDLTDKWNGMRDAEGLKKLAPTSGFRNAEKNILEMLTNVRAAKSPEIQAELLKRYRPVDAPEHYQKSLKEYFANRTEENLAKVREARQVREDTTDGGHSSYDAMDFSVSGMTKAEADASVAWLRAQGKKADLEYWGQPRQHIHVEGVKDSHD